ncbi:FAD-binding protein (plasmid) [Paroceanicella profunda]|uniref:FAD-binding protein n=1 Tax=Paroceanicella profunda TaxID=2579971 RepID=A0A5B8G0S7_9RHOB|nr:NAD(P)-binding protein [Paroceanicella profunda]QDL94726.1 FAD-binding protein [Paroceanicella profunda]
MNPLSPPKNRYDVLVLGAGVTGLALARILSARGNSVCLMDDYASPGGNHISWTLEGMSFDVGAIFFWSDNPLFELFPGLARRCLDVRFDAQRITPDGAVRAYPFDMRAEVLDRPLRYRLRVARELAAARLRPMDRRSAEGFLRRHLGPTLTRDSGILNYMQRFYGLAPGEISFAFAESRMRWVSSRASLRARLQAPLQALLRAASRRRAARGPAPRCLVRPPEGFAAFYAEAVAGLEAAGVRTVLDAGLHGARRHADGFEVTSAAGTFSAARLISTIPMLHTANLLEIPVAAPPVSRRLTTLCCRFSGQRGFTAPVLYNFHAEGAWKRLTMQSDFYGTPGAAEYFSLEVCADGAPGAPAERGEAGPGALFAEFARTARAAGLFTGDLTLLASHDTEFAYPVYDHSAAHRRDALAARLGAEGVELAGRQGLFQYIPSSALAVRLAEAGLA